MDCLHLWVCLLGLFDRLNQWRGGAPAANTGSASDGHLDEEMWKKEGFAFFPCLAFALAGEFIYSELQQLLIPSLKTTLFRLPT